MEDNDMRLHRTAIALALVLAVLVAAAGAQTTAPVERRPDVPYVPTNEAVVDQMLKMARVGQNDVVYDLGSGDGRIVIAAVQRYGAARGVGIDIDPDRVREARENAQKAGVADRVTFIQGDLFQADIREATVVTMYLLQDVNLRLRPKLLSDLRPGTRVVSHNYHMGDWEPKEKASVPVGGIEHTVYFWVIPPRTGRAS
jgi:ubiquinone/menaquinone biosynthesis C-methylase UbiE